jgi:hypothetical protein
LGAAVAELAICLPAVVLLVMGAIECCTMIFLKQSLHVTAYEGVRMGIKNEADSQMVRDRCDRVLQERNIVGGTVNVTPREVGTAIRGTPIEVQVTAPCLPNSALRLQFFGGNLETTAVMIKE